MTDPVDTDALRAMAAAGDYNMGPFAVSAADEVDRLRAALKDADDRLALGVLVNLDGEQFVDHPVMQMLAEKNERLRTVIENAPHEEPRDGDDGYGCQTNPCTCWKADAL